jgi:hypothetical protein
MYSLCNTGPLRVLGAEAVVVNMVKFRQDVVDLVRSSSDFELL